VGLILFFFYVSQISVSSDPNLKSRVSEALSESVSRSSRFGSVRFGLIPVLRFRRASDQSLDRVDSVRFDSDSMFSKSFRSVSRSRRSGSVRFQFCVFKELPIGPEIASIRFQFCVSEELSIGLKIESIWFGSVRFQFRVF
jgi:hypothetical protein